VGAWLAGSITTVWALLATVVLLWPGFGVGWFGTSGNAGDSLPSGFAGHRTQYELTQMLPLVLFALIGIAFYAAGAKTRTRTVEIPFEEELVQDASAPSSTD
jgi:hypothetical protein